MASPSICVSKPVLGHNKGHHQCLCLWRGLTSQQDAPRAYQLNLVKSWGSSQVYAQTPRANIMKWLVLQLLTLYCLGILPASGNWKERIDSLDEFPIYRSSSRNNKISNMMSTVEPLNRQ
ncbi:WAP four-disulfide core domain protein 3 isoform X4 [Equus asinus]|uniref:WAP four-disulfide core domain protein 3 isoform X4 n=1 Tax=Equus asinus TaxID=9793 RepID=UPI0038F7F026